MLYGTETWGMKEERGKKLFVIVTEMDYRRRAARVS